MPQAQRWVLGWGQGRRCIYVLLVGRSWCRPWLLRIMQNRHREEGGTCGVRWEWRREDLRSSRLSIYYSPVFISLFRLQKRPRRTHSTGIEHLIGELNTQISACCCSSSGHCHQRSVWENCRRLATTHNKRYAFVSRRKSCDSSVLWKESPLFLLEGEIQGCEGFSTNGQQWYCHEVKEGGQYLQSMQCEFVLFRGMSVKSSSIPQTRLSRNTDNISVFRSFPWGDEEKPLKKEAIQKVPTLMPSLYWWQCIFE